jgi:hypothetical protein
MAQILPFTALASASSTGPGAVVDLNGTSNEFSMFVVTSGSPSAAEVQLEGSHDGVNWFDLPVAISAITGNVASTEFTNGQVESYLPGAQVKPFARYVRANLETLTGGTSPTVTATVAVGKVV